MKLTRNCIEADITGLMAKPIDNWQARAEELCRPEFWIVTMTPAAELWNRLTADEQLRLIRKVELVRRFVGYQLAEMVKGTIKYATDNRSLAEWMANVIGEGADQMNYQLLASDAFEKDKSGK